MDSDDISFIFFVFPRPASFERHPGGPETRSVPLGTVRNVNFNPLEVHSNIADPEYGNFFGTTGRRFVFDFDVLF